MSIFGIESSCYRARARIIKMKMAEGFCFSFPASLFQRERARNGEWIGREDDDTTTTQR